MEKEIKHNIQDLNEEKVLEGRRNENKRNIAWNKHIPKKVICASKKNTT